MELLSILSFLALKILTYSGWSWIGLRYLARASTAGAARVERAIRFGVLRFAIGFLVGVLFAVVAGLAAPGSAPPATAYLVVVAIVIAVLRWLEWSVIGVLVESLPWERRSFLIGSGGRAAAWRGIGVLLSFATDLGTAFGVGMLGLVPC
jgi:hypothetical protein